MTWEHHFDRARRSTGVTVSKDQVGPIPPIFESVSLELPGLFSIYEQTRGGETIRIVELPWVYRITVTTQTQGVEQLFEPPDTNIGLIDPSPTTTGSINAPTGLNLNPRTKRKLAVGGLALLGIAALGQGLSGSQTTKQRTHRVFVSHSWKYEDQFQEIKSTLDNAWGFEWYDHSVSSDEPIDAQLPNHLRTKLRDQIQSTHVVLVLAGMYAAHSEWMEAEIEIATEMGKPVIGVIPPGNERAPQIVQKHATEIVPFDGAAILDAIRNHT